MKTAIWIVTLVSVVFSVASIYAMTEITDPNHKRDFARVIRIMGYVCDECSGAYAMGTKHRGLEFRVLCNEDSLAYRVTATPGGTFIVEPW